MCNRRQQLSSCEAHSPSVWPRALRIASTWLPGPSPARWVARPPARPGRTTVMGVHHSFGHARPSHPVKEHGRLAEEARGYLKTTGRHVPSPGERRNAVRSRGVLQVLRRVWRTCHDVLPAPPSRNRLQNVGSVVFFIPAYLKHMFIILTLK